MSIKTTKLTVAELCQLNTELSSEKDFCLKDFQWFKYHLSKIAKRLLMSRKKLTN
jgi:hypothetical protein